MTVGERVRMGVPLTTGNPGPLRRTMIELRELRRRVSAFPNSHFVLDMRECASIDAGGTLLLRAELERGALACGASYQLVWPKADVARFAVTFLGFRGEGAHDTIIKGAVKEGEEEANESNASDTNHQMTSLKISSGAKGEGDTGRLIFETARLAEQFGNPALANRVHAALNEAADNVLSWAYEDPACEVPVSARRWWTLGILEPGKPAWFVALDHGMTIPGTARRRLGDEFQRALRELLRLRKGRTDARSADADALRVTITLRRSQSGKGERGKGLTNMIGLIDQAGEGQIVIISGDAVFTYQRAPGAAEAEEVCAPLGWKFEGTMIIWRIADTAAASGGGR